MAMYPESEQASYSPTAQQLERERALKRYNRLYIYLPVVAAALAAVFLLVLMLIGIFAPGLVGAEEFLSGLADTILVLWMLPMMVLCAFVPIAYLGYLANRRQRRSLLPPDSPLLRYGRAQITLWKTQDIVDQVERTTEQVSGRVARPFINLNAFAAYVLAWLNILTRQFRRENNDHPDGPGARK